MNNSERPNETTRLLDRWKAANGIESDYEAAKRLKVSRNAVSQWRNRPSQAQPKVIIRMCRDLGIDAAQVLMQMAGGPCPLTGRNGARQHKAA